MTHQRLRVGSKKSVQTCPEVARREGRSRFYVRSVRLVREHGKMATCLREAAPAKAGNAAGGFFQQTRLMREKSFNELTGFMSLWLTRAP
jgi:hypothetical protein